MNTTTAAIEAGVTVATIRDWARRGIITATKTAGRWVIDTASLAHRIAIGAMKRPVKARPVVYSIDTMTAIGGSRWQRGTMDRVYLNDWAQFAGIDVAYYGTGSVSSASIGGRGVANGRVAGLLNAISKAYFDAADGRLHIQHNDADAYDIRYLSGERDTINLIELVFTGVRTAIAAL